MRYFRIITEQICETETQTIVFEQYYASLGGFSHDLTRNSNRHVCILPASSPQTLKTQT
jgi:hypothetical protein